MTAVLKATLGALPQIVVVLLVLAGVGILASTNHLSPTNAYGLVMLIIGATGVAAGLVLGSTKPNATLVIHAVIALAILALAIVLTLRNVFTETEVLGVLTVLLGSGVTAAVSQSTPTPTPVVGNLGSPVTLDAPTAVQEPPVAAPPVA
jgi:hypothetical protein